MKKAQALRAIQQASNNMAENMTNMLKVRYAIPESMEALASSKKTIVDIAKVFPGISPEQFIIDHYQEEIDFLKTIPSTIYPMIIVYSITMFEVFLSELAKTLMSYFPQSLKSTEKTMSYAAILDFDNIQALRQHIIETDLMKFSFGSIKERIRFLEKRYKLEFKYARGNGIRNNWNCIEYDPLIEVHAARNLIVHNAGIVNKIYLAEVPATHYKLGEQLNIDEVYLLDAISTLFRVQFAFARVCRGKISG